jgi:hypothetical protein
MVGLFTMPARADCSKLLPKCLPHGGSHCSFPPILHRRQTLLHHCSGCLQCYNGRFLLPMPSCIDTNATTSFLTAPLPIAACRTITGRRSPGKDSIGLPSQVAVFSYYYLAVLLRTRPGESSELTRRTRMPLLTLFIPLLKFILG